MRKGKMSIVAAVLLATILAAAALATGCGGSSSPAEEASSSPAAIEGTAAERAEAILGHAPAGLAKKIIDSGTVVVTNDPNYPPQSSIDKDTGELVGFDVDVAKKMAEILGLTIKWDDSAWETIPAQLKNGGTDVSIGSMTITPERDKTLDFTDPYYYTSGQVFVKTGGAQITGIEDLAGKKVGVGAATTYYDYLKANSDAAVKTYTTDADAFPDLLNGNIDFVMTAGPTGQEAISQGKEMEFSGDPLYYEDLAFAIKQGEADWLALLNYAVRTMHEDGSLSAMSQTWYAGLDLTVKSE